MRRACAITLAVVTPTRRPVKRPGPVPTATAARWSSSTAHSRRRYSIAGASCSAWRRPPASCTEPMTVPPSPNATDTCAVDVSRASSSTSAAHGRDQGVAPLDPGNARGLDRHDAVVVAVARLQQHAQPVARQRRAHAVAPLDEGHRVTADQIVEAQVVQLLQAVEAVHVDVHQRRGRVVLAHDRERGAHDRLVDPERDRDALGQDRLAGTELAVEDDHVTCAQHCAESLAERVGLPGALGGGAQCHDAPEERASARLMVTKSARACASAAPPLRNTADGWNTGMSTAPSRNGNSFPRSLVMPSLVSRSSLVAKLPSVTTTRGSMNAICASRYGQHDSISSGSGSRLPGGRHFTTLAMYTSARVRPMPSIRLVRRRPARPTNGSPVRSSCSPGPSPTKRRSACGSPTPKTTCVRVAASGHFVHVSASRSRSANEAN